MFKNQNARNRHNRLMGLVDEAIRDAIIQDRRAEDGRPDVTPTDIAALAFGRFQIHLSLDEAVSYLDAALVGRGYHPSSAS